MSVSSIFFTISNKVYATKSSGRLNPPLRFMYCLYFRFRITWTPPTSLPSTFFPFVVSKPQNPIIFIISCSSGVFPWRSASGRGNRNLEMLFYSKRGFLWQNPNSTLKIKMIVLNLKVMTIWKFLQFVTHIFQQNDNFNINYRIGI